MAGYGRVGGCHRRPARVWGFRPVGIMSASCTKNSLNRPNGKPPGDPPHRGASVFGRRSLAARDARLLADHDDDEGAGLHLAAAFTRSRWIEVGGGEKDVVGLEVETH